MRQRRETAEHPFGTLKMRVGATHFLMRRLPKVATEMALHVLAYNLIRVMNVNVNFSPVARSPLRDLVRRHATSMFGGLRLAKPHLSRSPTLSALDRRNRPPIAPYLSQAMCQPPQARRSCRKDVTSMRNGGRFHQLKERRKFGRRESMPDTTSGMPRI